MTETDRSLRGRTSYRGSSLISSVSSCRTSDGDCQSLSRSQTLTNHITLDTDAYGFSFVLGDSRGYYASFAAAIKGNDRKESIDVGSKP